MIAWIRSIVGVIAGFVVASVVMMCVEQANAHVFYPGFAEQAAAKDKEITQNAADSRLAADSSEVLMTDRQVDTQPKAKGAAIFSTTGKAPGNNHHKYGGNYLLGDGHVEMSLALAPLSLVWTQGVVLLNPKP